MKRTPIREERNKRLKSRRTFVKTAGGGSLAAAAGMATGTGCGSRQHWSSTFDWICVGSGMAGCAAAIAGHDQGLKTLLLEKSDKIGGLTSQSGGILWAPMNYLMTGRGLTDTRQEALEYLNYLGSGYNIREYTETFVDHTPRVIEYLHQKANIDFRLSDQGECYFPSKRKGRIVKCDLFQAQSLGAWRDRVQLSIFHHGLSQSLGSLEHDPALGGGDGPSSGHSGPLRDPDDSRLALWRKWLGPQLEPMLARDEEQRVAGAGLAAYMFRAVLRRGIPVQMETSAEELLVEEGRVVGVRVKKKGEWENIRANRGIALATGAGINGWRLAAPLQAALSSTATIQGRPRLSVPGEAYPDGSVATRRNYEIRMRHGLVVNRFGERFGNEFFGHELGSKTNHFDTRGEHRFRNIPSFLIFDRDLLEKYSFAGLPPGSTEGLDWVTRGDTLGQVAAQLELPGDRLEATIKRFNASARRGVDSDVSRPPESLAPIEKGPFFGVQLVTPDPFRAKTTIDVNTRAQVLDYRSDLPIAGLYACGAATSGSRIWGIGYQAGYSLMACATFGFLAAEQAAGILEP